MRARIEKQNNQQIIFKRRLTSESDESAILNAFENLLKNKPVGYWLIRESRMPGLLSVSYRKNNADNPVDHARFGFIEDRWVCLNNGLAAQSVMMQIEHLDRTNIGSKCEDLIQLIESRNLSSYNQVLPHFDQATETALYSGYCSMPQETGVYNNPIDTLRQVLSSLSEKIRLKGFDPQDQYVNFEEYQVSFIEWISTKYQVELCCPISRQLYTNPYVIHTGCVIDRNQIFNERGEQVLTVCPYTEEDISMVPPRRLIGYQSLLKQCLMLHAVCKEIEKMEQNQRAHSVADLSMFSSSTSSSDRAYINFTDDDDDKTAEHTATI